jgi:hypothetical protein
MDDLPVGHTFGFHYLSHFCFSIGFIWSDGQPFNDSLAAIYKSVFFDQIINSCTDSGFFFIPGFLLEVNLLEKLWFLLRTADQVSDC